MHIPPLLKNKQVQLAIGISLILLVLVILFSPKSPPPEVTIPSGPLPSTTRPELIDVPEDTRQESRSYREEVEKFLPLYLENFETSVGLTTTINIFVMPDDPKEVIRFEIYGLSYLNSDSSPFTNPNVTAFQESYRHGLDAMRERGIDPSRLIFIYGDVEYVRETAGSWVEKFNLKP
jgi:hypothetical protein